MLQRNICYKLVKVHRIFLASNYIVQCAGYTCWNRTYAVQAVPIQCFHFFVADLQTTFQNKRHTVSGLEKIGKSGSFLQENFFVTLTKNIKEICHTGWKFGQTGGKISLACREINIFSRPVQYFNLCLEQDLNFKVNFMWLKTVTPI